MIKSVWFRLSKQNQKLASVENHIQSDIHIKSSYGGTRNMSIL